MTLSGEPLAPAVTPGSDRAGGQALASVVAAELRVVGQASEVRVARSFAAAGVGELGADDDARDSVRVLVSELVTNVVLHARTDAVIRVREDGVAHVLVEVVDGSPVLPTQRRAHGSSTTGRGMRLLKVLAAESGVEPDPAVAPDGKRVWFRLAKRGDAASEHAVQEAAVELFDVSWEVV